MFKNKNKYRYLIPISVRLGTHYSILWYDCRARLVTTTTVPYTILLSFRSGKSYDHIGKSWRAYIYMPVTRRGLRASSVEVGTSNIYARIVGISPALSVANVIRRSSRDWHIYRLFVLFIFFNLPVATACPRAPDFGYHSPTPTASKYMYTDTRQHFILPAPR